MPLLHRADAPPKTAPADPPVLAVRLTASESDEMPVSFRIAMEGCVTLEITWPEALRRKELAATGTITVNAADWYLSKNVLSTKWKSAMTMTSKSMLIWPGTLPESDPKHSAASILQEKPLALRLGLLRSGKSGRDGFYIIGANYQSEALNDASVQFDPDDMTAVTLLPTTGSHGALMRQVLLRTSGDQQHEHTILLERTIGPCIPPLEQPGAAMPTLRDSFNKAFAAAKEAGDVPLMAARLMKTTRRRSDKSAGGRRAESSSAYDTDASTAAHDTAKGKYHHHLDYFWFKDSVPQRYREIFSSSISMRTAYHYGQHIKTWISHCTAENRDPLSPSIAHLVDYLAFRAQAQPVSTLKLALAAIRKFFEANLVDTLVLDSPSIKALLVGLTNRPRQSRAKTHRLAMNRSGLTLAGHTLHSQEWPERDKTAIWSLFLVAYYASARIGDLVSSHANIASCKALRWADVSLSDSGAELYLRQPKCSVGNKGHSLFLIQNPETKFCPVHFLAKLKSESSEGPVYALASGKFVTIALVNKILKQTSQLAGLPDGIAYSAHSFRAAMPTAIAQNQSTFSAAEVRAAGRWRSDAADRYVRCQKGIAESIATRAYSLNL